MRKPKPNLVLVAAIDAFVAMDKRLIGADEPPTWREGREQGLNEWIIKLPLEVAGEQRGQSLMVQAYPNSPSLKFRIAILFEPSICRLDFELACIHPNAHAEETEGLKAIVKGPHLHAWDDNKRFFYSATLAPKLHNAYEIPTNIRSFDSALRWFCTEYRIELPGSHRIELPTRTTLF